MKLPEGMHTITPHLVCDGAADAIDFYQRAFGAHERMRLAGPDGRLMHASLVIDGSSVMLVDASPAHGARDPKAIGGTPVTIHLLVEDADAAVDRAVRAGAKVVMPVADMFWGDRYGVVEDPFGHRWSIAKPGGGMSQEELVAAARRAMAQ